MIFRNNSHTSIFKSKGCDNSIPVSIHQFLKSNGMCVSKDWIQKNPNLKENQKHDLKAFSSYIWLYFYFYFAEEPNCNLNESIIQINQYFGKTEEEKIVLFKKQDLKLKNRFYNIEKLKLKKKNSQICKRQSERSILVIGEVFDFYAGSISPFHKTNCSWLVSTGLKADIECGAPELIQSVLAKEDLIETYDYRKQDLIFKVYNFKQRINVQGIKQNIRFCFFYQSYHFFGFQRFFSESKINWILLQNSRMEEEFQLDGFLKRKIIDKYNLARLNLGNLDSFRKEEIKKSFFGIYLIKIKTIFLFFKMMQSFLNFYNLFLNQQEKPTWKYGESLFKSFCSLIWISKKIISIFHEILFYILIPKRKNFLKKNKKENSRRDDDLFLHSFFSSFALTQEIISRIKSKFFWKFSFQNFLKKKENLVLWSRIEKNLDPIDLKRFDERIYYSENFKKEKMDLFFLIELKLNFQIWVQKCINPTQQVFLLNEQFERFFNLIESSWIKRKISISEINYFFSIFVERSVLNLKDLFFSIYNHKMDLNNKFQILTSWIYFSKMKTLEENPAFQNNAMTFSDFFLGKWFYYRQRNKLMNDLSDCYYHDSNSPNYEMNSYQTRNWKNLLKIQKLGLEIPEKLVEKLKKNQKDRLADRLKKSSEILKKFLKNVSPKKKIFSISNGKLIRKFRKRFLTKSFRQLKKKLSIQEKEFLKKKYKFFKRHWKRKFWRRRVKKRLKMERWLNIHEYRRDFWQKRQVEFGNRFFEINLKFTKRERLKKTDFLRNYTKLERRFGVSLRRFFGRGLLQKNFKYKKSGAFRLEEFQLTNTFLCLYSKAIFLSKEYDTKLIFWFKKEKC